MTGDEVGTSLLDKLRRAWDWVRNQKWWPTRKWWTDAVTFVCTFLAVKLGLGADDPFVVGAISLVVAKVLSYVMPDRDDEPAPSHKRARAKAAERARKAAR